MSKVKVLKKQIKDQNLIDMFNQMVGGEGDPQIVIIKKERINGCLAMVSKILASFADGPFGKALPEYKEWCTEFKAFGDRVGKLVETKDTKEPVPYATIKEHNDVKHVILVCKEIAVYEHYLKESKLSDKWITSHPGLVFQPFAFTAFDIKHVWNNSNVTDKIKKYCLTTISVLYAKCHEVYEIVTSPDINIKQFSVTIVESLLRAQKDPKLSRCKDAFKKITESVSKLETNFSGYYKDMVQSQNPNTIIESFLVDVSQGQSMNVSLMRQFRTIIGYFRTQSQGKVKDPKVKKLFESLNDKIGILENMSSKKKTDKKDEKDEKDVKGDKDDKDEQPKIELVSDDEGTDEQPKKDDSKEPKTK